MSSKKSSTKAKKKISEKQIAKKLREDIWPVERSVLFRPDRFKYVRKLVEPDGCVFCSALKAGINEQSLLLSQSKHSMLILNKYPYNPGHLLVLPRRHIGEFLELSNDEHTDLHNMLKTAFAAVTKAFEPKGINIGLNHGGAAGAGIPDHLHYHLVPRWKGDLNFFPLIAETKAIPSTLNDSYRQLRECLP